MALGDEALVENLVVRRAAGGIELNDRQEAVARSPIAILIHAELRGLDAHARHASHCFCQRVLESLSLRFGWRHLARDESPLRHGYGITCRCAYGLRARRCRGENEQSRDDDSTSH